MIRTVSVQFCATGKTYTYLYDGEVKVGDYVVVAVPRTRYSADESYGYQVVKVTDIVEGRGPKATKYIVDVVNVEAYEQRVENEKKRQAIIAELTERQKKMDEETRFAMLAARDPEAARLLEELRHLGRASGTNLPQTQSVRIS